MKQARPDPDYRPGIREMAQWEEEWRTSGSTVSIQWFIMEKTADFAADVELRVWSSILNGVGYMGMATQLERERRPPPPELYVYRDGYTYKLIEE
jgi:hypothetical protein